MSFDIEVERAEAIDKIVDGEHIPTVCLQCLPETAKYGFLDDIYDEDGDSIIAELQPRFLCEGAALVRAEFPQGTDPKYVANVLRKYADMLDGPYGILISNLALRGHPTANTEAKRDYDGTVYVYNLGQELEEYGRMMEEETRQSQEREADGHEEDW